MVGESQGTLRDELRRWNLEEIAEIFEKEKITLPILWDFNDEELQKLGVGLVQRKKYVYAKDHLNSPPLEKVTLSSKNAELFWCQRSLTISQQKS